MNGKANKVAKTISMIEEFVRVGYFEFELADSSLF